MGQVNEINIKNRTYYFFNDMIIIEVFDSNFLKIDRKSHINTGIYNIEYITIKKLIVMKIFSANPLYLIIGEVDGFIEEKNQSQYLVFDSTDENKEVFEKYTTLGQD